MQELLKTSLPMATTRGLVRAKENNRSCLLSIPHGRGPRILSHYGLLSTTYQLDRAAMSSQDQLHARQWYRWGSLRSSD